LDGYEVCRRLKQDDRTNNIPVIFITAKMGVEDEAKGLELGAVDYIVKPFSLPIIKARVRTHLELKRNRDILENIAHLDGLTGIRNRRFLDDMLTSEWRRGNRRETKISLIMIDIDRFKEFNDNYGHMIGDDCLRRVAATLTDSVRRPADFVARYGGEEFAAVLPETDLPAAMLIADLMRKRVESLDIEHRTHPEGRITISLGVATMQPSRMAEPAALMAAADKLLYESKEAGRNCVRGQFIEG
jgi:diguanylate cyclase (GGDEF)-like protein